MCRRCGYSAHNTESKRAKGKRGHSRGIDNERKFLRAYLDAQAEGTLPGWIYSIRPASREEDHELKYDVVFRTDAGVIGVQIKSSERGRLAFLRTSFGERVPCFVVRGEESAGEILARSLPDIKKERDRLLQMLQNESEIPRQS